MKKMLMTLAAVLCCAMVTSVFTSCRESEEEVQSKLVGTWTEKNDLYADELTLNEDGSFTFRSSAVPSMRAHANRYSGSGSYKLERKKSPNYNFDLNNYREQYTDILYLIYSNKDTQTLEIRKVTSSELEMSDRYGYTFHFGK